MASPFPRLTLLLGLSIIAAPSSAPAHGDAEWIGKGGYRNNLNELCCGERDCEEIDAAHVTVTATGYFVRVPMHPSPDGLGLIGGVKEFVPFSEALPSPDGKYWRCAWGGKRRCFFDPQPLTQ